MGGLLTHLIAGTASAIAIQIFHQRLEFSLVIFLGNLLPDMIKFGFSAIIKGTVNILSVVSTRQYTFLSSLTDDVTNWFTVAFFFTGLFIFLYHYHVIKKKTFEEYEELTGLLVFGVITHILIDLMILETSPWI